MKPFSALTSFPTRSFSQKKNLEKSLQNNLAKKNDRGRSRNLIFLTLIGLTLTTPQTLAQSEVGSPVFYPENLPENCETIISQLEAGQYPLSLETGTEQIGLSPQWQTPGRSPYLSSRLQSLRFLACYIRAGERGNQTALNTARSVILNWAKANALGTSPEAWTEKNNTGAWEAQTTAERAVILSYFYWVYAKSDKSDPEILQQLQTLAQTHGNVLARPLVYKPDHHQGLANSLALLALGSVFQDLPEANLWIELGVERAEQQMQDNVSADGIHLEQSGEVHHIAVQNFMAIYRAVQGMNLPLSAAYRQKLDRMLGASALMMGGNRRVEGLPDSDPNKDMTATLLKAFNNLDLGSTALGQGLLVKMKRREISRGLHLYRQGGYSFFVPGSNQELEAVFKTHILNSPNFHQDALMVTARIGDRELLIYPSKHTEAPLDPYFVSPAGSNTVQVKPSKPLNQLLNQSPAMPRKREIEGSGVNRLNVNTLVNRLERLNPFSRQPEAVSADPIPLEARVVPQNGQVMAFGSSSRLDFVTAQHQTYPGVIHTRTVARIGSDLLLVWDQLESNTLQSYIQTFHFPPNLRVKLTGSEGILREGQDPIARFIQLKSPVLGRVCRGRMEPQACGWYSDPLTLKKVPAPAVLYETQTQHAGFLWILSAGARPLKARVDSVQEGVESYQLVTLSKGDQTFRLVLKELTVQLEN
ncbi:MAG: heparinase II/III family protein [Microcoleaceae cyanobacterium]